MNFKQTVLLVSIWLLGNICTYEFVKSEFFTPDISRCGVVELKFNNDDVSHHKSHTTVTTYTYLDVKFDDGKYERIKVTADTYYKKFKGDKVCFDFDAERKTSFFILAIGLIFFVIDIILAVVLIVLFFILIWNLLETPAKEHEL